MLATCYVYLNTKIGQPGANHVGFGPGRGGRAGKTVGLTVATWVRRLAQNRPRGLDSRVHSPSETPRPFRAASHAAISPWACTVRTRASAAACASQTPCSACPHTARRTAHRLPCPDARVPGASSGGSGRTALNASTAALFFLTHSPPTQSRSALWSGQMLARRNIRSELSLGASHAAGGGTGGTHSCAVLVIPASRRQPQPLRQNSKHMPSGGCR